MPPQEDESLLDFVGDGLDLGTHIGTPGENPM
jgi:hypothetical protein